MDDKINAVLEKWNLYASLNGDVYEVYDMEDVRFTVSSTISEFDLLALLNYGVQRFISGSAYGAASVRAEFRAMLGIEG